MADLSDVLNAYAAAAATALYPSTPGPTDPSPTAGLVVSIGAGWPSPQSLDAILANGSAVVTTYAPPGMERNTTRYPEREQVGTLNAATITLTASGQIVTLGGVQAAYAQNLGMFIDGAIYTAHIPANTSLTAAASLLAAAYSGATSSGPAITIPAGHAIGALRKGGYATTQKEIRRQQRMIQVCTWAPSPAARDAICKVVDLALAQGHWLEAEDGSSIRSIYQRTMQIDNDQKQGLFRRDLYYLAEYPTLVEGQATQIIAFETVIETVAGDVIDDTTV